MALADVGLQVPRPLMVDLSGKVLPSPYLVLPFVEGTSTVEPSDLPSALGRMADFLVRLHGLDLPALGLPTLPLRDDPIPDILKYLPASHAFGELQALLEEGRAVHVSSGPAVLHGDFWPGNVLWREGEIAAVVDWEDAAIGDPLSDVACCRVELLWRYGEQATNTFTERYVRRRGGAVDPLGLALWDVVAGSGALAFMGNWGFAAEVEAAMRRKATGFVERAAGRAVEGLRAS
jgi:aminoglycoside phosphotransferase (APT) family kinase protein